MPAIALAAVPYLMSRLQPQDNVSVSQYGKRAMLFTQFADTALLINMRTVPLSAEQVTIVDGWATELVRTGRQTILYTPKENCLPRAYWGFPNNPHINDTGLLTSVTNGVSVVIGSVTNGLTLLAGDRLSFQSGEYRSLHKVASAAAIAAGGSITVTLASPVPPYITNGAIVRFRDPELNTRVMPNTFQIPDEFFPTASFTLVEVPR